MELAQELMMTAVVAVLVSFLIAKLVSMVMAGDSSRDSKLTTSDRNFDRDTNDEVDMEELRFRERLQIRGFSGEKWTEAVGEAAATRKVDVFVGEAGRVDGSGKSVNRGVVAEIECSQLADDSVEKGLKEEGEEQNKSLGEMLAKKEEVSDNEERVDSKEGKEVNLEQLQPICVDLAGESSGVVEQSEEISIVESELKEHVDEKKIEIESEEDDWEGIERSELEKSFAKAAKFVESGDLDGRLSRLGSDVLIKLYGLHKLVTEGPCREQPPMALKVAARAKWNAWQRLGNMSPEVAMEQYIALVSDRVPGWMEDNSTGDGNLGSSVSTSPGAAAPDISTLSFNQQDIKNERTLEPRTGAENSDLPEGLTLENRVKE
uniref:Acyl-CoA binding protein 3B n=1 Tax=Rhizophora mucronata TaxID=61149 RepID=A0A2P2JCE0_RHIMU